MKRKKNSPFAYQWFDASGKALPDQTGAILQRHLLPAEIDAQGAYCVVTRLPEPVIEPKPQVPELSGDALYAFRAHITEGAPDHCWNWKGATAVGYGRFKTMGKVYGAHRIAYALAHGPIPKGLLVMHSCDNPPCCNPAHLKLGTYRDNAIDMAQKGRAPAQIKNKSRADLSTNGS